MAYHTKTQTLILIVPATLPSNDRAEYLQKLYQEHVVYAKGDWKGPNAALVPANLADDVAEAMEFMGALVDTRVTNTRGTVALYSKGYRAHGF